VGNDSTLQTMGPRRRKPKSVDALLEGVNVTERGELSDRHIFAKKKNFKSRKLA